MFVRGLNNLHVLSNVGFYIDGIGQESYVYFNAHVTLFTGVSSTLKRMMTDRLNTMNLISH